MAKDFYITDDKVAILNHAYAWGRDVGKLMLEMHAKVDEGFTVIGHLNGVNVIMTKEA